MITARMAPTWMIAVNAVTGSSTFSPRSPSAMVRWPVLDTGRNSVTPSRMPSDRASIRFMAILGTSRGCSSLRSRECPNVTSRDARRGERRRQLTEPHLDEPERRSRGKPGGKRSWTEDPPKSPRIGQTGPDSDAPTPGASTCPRNLPPSRSRSEHRALTWRGSVSMGQALSGMDTTSRVETKASQELCDDDNSQHGYSGCGRDSSGYAHLRSLFGSGRARQPAVPLLARGVSQGGYVFVPYPQRRAG